MAPSARMERHDRTLQHTRVEIQVYSSVTKPLHLVDNEYAKKFIWSIKFVDHRKRLQKKSNNHPFRPFTSSDVPTRRGGVQSHLYEEQESTGLRHFPV
ncbi:hypothetical protein L6452_01759 [Arctium lappa]|uniref:Uncharacterized protein n=1 Tax=Arctium lappa TaxID=4217 RepID=A0ACB9FH06_ARCLA|nr:hypothetical protein L6452_01759 [Arctium lappa]